MKKEILTKSEISIKLDAKDRKLLAALETDARASVTNLARKMGASKEVANYRLKRLADSGLIKGFYTVIDYFSFGLSLYKMLINFHDFDDHVLKKITADLKKVYGANYSVLVQSIRDLDITLWVRHPKEFYDFYDEFLDKYSAYIQNKEFFLVTRVYYLNHAYLHGSAASVVIGAGKHQKIDEKDFYILDVLSKHARMPTIEIAKKVKLTPNAVHYRIKQLLEKGVVKGFRPVIDSSLLGYDTYKVLIMLNNTSKRRMLIQTLLMNPNVLKISKTIGYSDMEVKVNFTSLMELENFLRSVRTKYHSIKNFEIIAVAED